MPHIRVGPPDLFQTNSGIPRIPADRRICSRQIPAYPHPCGPPDLFPTIPACPHPCGQRKPASWRVFNFRKKRSPESGDRSGRAFLSHRRTLNKPLTQEHTYTGTDLLKNRRTQQHNTNQNAQPKKNTLQEKQRHTELNYQAETHDKRTSITGNHRYCTHQRIKDPSIQLATGDTSEA